MIIPCALLLLWACISENDVQYAVFIKLEAFTVLASPVDVIVNYPGPIQAYRA
jgi:hypothetical protein